MLTLVQGLTVKRVGTDRIATTRDQSVRKIALKSRLLQLAHIGQVLEQAEASVANPWYVGLNWSWAALALVAAILTRAMLWSYGADYLSAHLSIFGSDRLPVLVTAAPFAVAAVVGLIGGVTSQRSTYTTVTREQWLVDVLADYEPLDRAAYKRLQDASRRHGSIDRAQVRAWLDQEYLAIEIQESIGESRGASMSRFLHKRV